MNDTRRIAIVLPTLGGGGAERVAITLAGGFIERGDAVDFIVGRAAGELRHAVPAQARVIDVAASRLRGMTLPLARYLRDTCPVAVHASMWPLTSFAVLAHRLARSTARLVLTDHVNLSAEHAATGPAHRAAMRLSMAATYRAADAITAVSHGVAADIARLAALPAGRVITIHNPIPLPVPGAAGRAAAGATAWRDGGARILTVGSLKPQKNHALLLESIARLGRPVQLAIVGDGPLRAMLEARAAALGIADRVIFAGYFADPSPWYDSADLFVLSSDFEGFGNVVAEALGHGLRVVSTDCPDGPAEILDHGKYGVLTPVGDAGALTAAIDRALDASGDAAAARRRAADFAPARAIERYRALLLPGAA